MDIREFIEDKIRGCRGVAYTDHGDGYLDCLLDMKEFLDSSKEPE
jgi:hypothetical protein